MSSAEVQVLLEAVAREVNKIDACVAAMEALRQRVESLANKLEAVMLNVSSLNASNIAKAALFADDASAAC